MDFTSLYNHHEREVFAAVMDTATQYPEIHRNSESQSLCDHSPALSSSWARSARTHTASVSLEYASGMNGTTTRSPSGRSASRKGTERAIVRRRVSGAISRSTESSGARRVYATARAMLDDV